MPEWWTYRPSDFLLFSPRTYYRIIERYNEALWPLHILALTLGCVVLVLLLRRRPAQPRIIWLSVAVLWGWIGWAFLWQRYATINWAVPYLLPLFAVEALLLLGAGWARKPLSFAPEGRAKQVFGLILLTGSVALYPAVAPLAGRPWRQAEVFGMAPDPTVIATVGLTLLATRGTPGWLLVIPVIWCLISGLTLWAMGSPEAWLPPAAALLGVGSIRLPLPGSLRSR